MQRSALLDWAQAHAHTPCDLLVVGGGATGLGVAVQAALEGRTVLLVEARDFACGTSSRSTKLLHGGVRYLAQGRIRLVREALRERAVVMGLAPHLAQPLPFVVAPRAWAFWALTLLGLKVYQGLAGRFSLGPSEALGRAALRARLPGLPGGVAGARYWDGQFEDARLALALAQTAQAAGARVRNHTQVRAVAACAQGWRVTLHDTLTQVQTTVLARTVVNATGVWVDAVRQMALDAPVSVAAQSAHADLPPLVRPSQGVHLVISRRLLPLQEAVLVPRTSDGRVLFALPWLGAIVIGTTDTPSDTAPLEPRATAEELAFLVGESRRALGLELRPEDVLSIWVGLRPLVREAGGRAGPTSQLSREHVILREAPGFVTVTGGKWTTYRRMAEAVLQTLVSAADLPAPRQPAHTDQHRLWGAPAPGTPGLDLRAPPGEHLLGTAAQVLGRYPGHGVALGLGLSEAVVRHCARHEWAMTVEDMLARRWRALFLDARAAAAMAPRVAQLLREETGQDPQLADFLALCAHYQCPAEAWPKSP